ncbi:MAG: DUF1553 domain-containing protein, partial [Planctomycetaceae bacterium]|nr:DUF1553 domain-containing protein [Planctomycetaceae bacterium]
RVHFDLIGLPPASEVVTAFVEEPTQRAYNEVVDQLLASDAYGERMAMFWLDLVRYADTVGYHGDQDHNSSPYRDWVIDSFASNMPFDQFTREQLAGDLIADSDVDQKIASCYNRLLQTTHEGGLQPKEYLAIYAADRVRNLSAVWMGATVGCAQCHNHKFDPYTSKDFYSLAAFFADVDEEDHFRTGTNALPTKRAPEMRVLTARERQSLAELQKQLSRLNQNGATTSDDKSQSEEIRRIKHAIEDLEASARSCMITVAKPVPRTTRVFPRGNWMDESGEVVQPAVPAFLRSAAVSVDSGLDKNRRLTRLDLANWLVDEDGIGLLTARVMVNRLWAIGFGTGISPSLDDFGGQGFPPEHPELLDQLAIEFVRSGWNVRHLMKLIVTSRTYQQSSDLRTDLNLIDPQNKWLARQNSFRLPAEMIRDNALAVSGLLVKQVGGGSVRPYQPAGYYRHLNFPIRKYSHHADQRQWRRGVYMHWQRQFLHPMLRAFDAPSREECTAQRARSNTPLAALVLLNDPTFVEASRVFAARVLQTTAHEESDAARISWTFRECVSRPPDAEELRLLELLLNRSRNEYLSNPERAAALMETGIAPKPEPSSTDSAITELAAWTTVCRAILNLDEVVTRY